MDDRLDPRLRDQFQTHYVLNSLQAGAQVGWQGFNELGQGSEDLQGVDDAPDVLHRELHDGCEGEVRDEGGGKTCLDHLEN